jgi:hypothetical protein
MVSSMNNVRRGTISSPLRQYRSPGIRQMSAPIGPPSGSIVQEWLRSVRYVTLSPLRTDSLPLVSKIYWPQNADDAIMDAP